MSAKSFWKNAKANYWSGRQQDIYNTYDNAANMGNARSSFNRAATVAGPGRQQLEKGYEAAHQSYKSMQAAEQRAKAAKDAKDAYFKFLRDNPELNRYDYGSDDAFRKAREGYNWKELQRLQYEYLTKN
jgi:hypothetical protein